MIKFINFFSFTQCTKEPAPKEGYVFTPGVGSHKLFTDAKDWLSASVACTEDGAHLAIVNSQEEELVS